jgi:hypothetical protein
MFILQLLSDATFALAQAVALYQNVIQRFMPWGYDDSTQHAVNF